MINEGDNCIISYSIKNDEVYKMMTIKKNKTVKINKHEFKWDNCIGKPYGYVQIGLNLKGFGESTHFGKMAEI